VKHGIDERDSMLTRENFFAAWAKPKVSFKGEKTANQAQPDEMVVDTPAMESKVAETTAKDDGMGVTETQSQAILGTTRLTGRGSRTIELPIFPFQRKGIGAVGTNKPYKLKPPTKRQMELMDTKHSELMST
jgi:hypothetical protein